MQKVFFLILTLFLLSTGVFSQLPAPASFRQITFVNDEQIRPKAPVQEALRRQAAWQVFTQKYGSWWVQFDERSSWPLMAAGAPIALEPADPVAAVKNFISRELAGFKLPLAELVFKNMHDNGKYKVLRFEQWHKGLKVLWSEAKFQLDEQGRLVFFKLRIYPIEKTTEASDLPESALETFAVAGLEGFEIQRVETDPGKYILPVVAASGEYEYRLVKEAKVFAEDESGMPSLFQTLVDLKSGEVLYRADKIHAWAPQAANLNISDSMVINPLSGGEIVNIPNLMVLINGDTLYTDENGNITLPDIVQPTEVRIFLGGKYAWVVNAEFDSTTVLIDTIYPGSNNLDLSGAKVTEINGYFHTDKVHEHMKRFLPADFTTLDIPLTVNIDIPTGSCNAFFNGSSINFFVAGNGCPQTSLFSDVIYHEYGHGINFFYYDYLGGTFSNGALGEAYSDVWGFSISKDPVLGRGFSGDSSTFVRRYDINRKVYPRDLVGQVHADGEIIAGAFWDLYLNLGDIDQMTTLFVGGHTGTPNAPDGMEGQLYSEILLQVLLFDDDDANISNGTPNDSAILDAFGKHGISLLTGVEILHEAPLQSEDSTGIVLVANVNTTLTTYIGELTLYYRNLGEASWNSLPMQSKGATLYTADLPDLRRGDILEYYFGINDIFAFPAAFDPYESELAGDANLPYFLMIGYQEMERQDFDNEFGPWFFNPDGDDDASTGKWTIESPNPSFSGSFMVQTNKDKTEIGNDLNLCAFTGNASVSASFGTNDVDDGKTTLQTPPFDVSDIENPAISYWRWFVNDPPGGANPGNDAWQVFISDDGVNWVRVERTFVSDVSWRQNVVRVEDYVTPSQTVSLRFIAQDSLITGLPFDGGSIVEAAVDEVQVFGLSRINTGIENPSLLQVRIFPSPANDQLMIASGEMQMEMLELFDLSGRMIKRVAVGGLQNFSMDVSDLQNGFYLLKIFAGKGSVSKKILIQH